jgi:hypothetical protein
MHATSSFKPRSLRSALALSALLAVPAVPSLALAQPAELPAPSPRARVDQRVGLTDFSLEYSSPAVKGRKIWGDLVPLDKPWRAGANAATKLTVSRDFSFGGTAVKAGSYSIFMTPTKAQWTVHLNSNPVAGPNEHDATKDVAKVSVAPVALTAPRERLIYLFNDTQDDRVSLELEWEKVRIRVPITVDTKAHVTAAIEKSTSEAWRPHAGAANYYFGIGDLPRALTMIDKSIAIQQTWRNEWVRAQILGKQGKKADAKAAAGRALNLGKGDKIFEQFFKAEIEKAIAGWK